MSLIPGGYQKPQAYGRDDFAKKTASVTIEISFPSETRKVKLKEELKSLGIMIAKGTFKQIANSAMRHPRIRADVFKLVLKEIDRECNVLCRAGSKKNPGKLKRLKELGLVTSHTFMYKTLDKFGACHDQHLRDNTFQATTPRKIVIDNFDFATKVHYMTEMHQNSDKHWVSVASTEKRVLDSSLSSRAPATDAILENQNYNFLPSTEEISEQHSEINCSNLGVARDQGSVERGVNVLLELRNGFTPGERLDGLHLEIADFHTGMKFLQYGFDHFYEYKGSMEKSTLYADRNLINRRNALSIQSMEEQPSSDILPANVVNGTNSVKKQYLLDVSSKVVDRFILQMQEIEARLRRQEYADWLASTNCKNEGGKFECRQAGCKQMFACNGKRRVEHEKQHGLYQVIKENVNLFEDDDMFCYQLSFLEYGMIVLNFLMPYLRSAQSLVWNCFHKAKTTYSGNILLDLMLEHFNNAMKIVIRQLGSNNTNKKAIDRYARAITTSMEILDNFDEECRVLRRSGKHSITSSIKKDLQKVVNELSSQGALQYKKRRKYTHFSGAKASLLEGFNIHNKYSWIETHKKNLAINRGQ
eukprot:gene13233-14591_t